MNMLPKWSPEPSKNTEKGPKAIQNPAKSIERAKPREKTEKGTKMSPATLMFGAPFWEVFRSKIDFGRCRFLDYFSDLVFYGFGMDFGSQKAPKNGCQNHQTIIRQGSLAPKWSPEGPETSLGAHVERIWDDFGIII